MIYKFVSLVFYLNGFLFSLLFEEFIFFCYDDYTFKKCNFAN